MEKLEGSLDDFIETVPNISIVLKRSILKDIARGMTLETLALLINIPPGQLAQTLSRVLGTPLYMPPEALSSAARYGPSLDVFSFGHLTLFTLTQV